MIYAGEPLEAEIPDVDLGTFVLGGARALAAKPALIDGPSGRALSYSELERSVRGFAAGLAARGFAQGDTIEMPGNTLSNLAYSGHVLSYDRTDDAAFTALARNLPRL